MNAMRTKCFALKCSAVQSRIKSQTHMSSMKQSNQSTRSRDRIRWRKQHLEFQNAHETRPSAKHHRDSRKINRATNPLSLELKQDTDHHELNESNLDSLSALAWRHLKASASVSEANIPRLHRHFRCWKIFMHGVCRD